MISCRIKPTRRLLSSAKPDPPKTKTLRKVRGVFVFAFTLLAPCSGRAQQPIGEVYASDAAVKGTVRETGAGLEVSNGSVITAGEHSATLRLGRGGQVRICPGTNLTINSSPKGQELMFAMSAGSLEAEYQLPATADVVLTPDFRILISGPAKAGFSVTAMQNGDACVRSRGDDSYVVVSELMGNDFYRLKPNEQAVFHAGRAKDPELNGAMTCGCPAPAPVERAEAAPPAPTPEQRAAVAAAIQNEPAVAATASAAAGLPPQSAGQVNVEIDAPMVFKGNSGAPPDVTATLARVHVEHLPWPKIPNVTPEPPEDMNKAKAQAAGTQKKGFFRRLVRALFG